MSELYADSVIKSYGVKQVLTDIFLSCSKGEIVGLIGRNGSGKSTLLKIIFGSLHADTKFIKVDNRIINRQYNSRKMINYLPQHNFLPNQVKIKRAISLFLNKEAARKIKKHPHIAPLLEKKSKQLSGGERRLVEILLILHSNAPFILIDEPFNGIAPVYKDEIKQMIKEQSANKGFIITDHDYRNIMDIATRTVLLFDGGTKEIKDPSELKYWGYLPEV